MSSNYTHFSLYFFMSEGMFEIINKKVFSNAFHVIDSNSCNDFRWVTITILGINVFQSR